MDKKKWIIVMRNNRVVGVVWAGSEQEAIEHAGNIYGGDRFPEMLKKFARAYTLEHRDSLAPFI